MWRHSIRRPLTEKQTEVSRSLETIVWILMAATPLLLVGLITLPQHSTRWLVLLGGIYLLCISTLVFNRRGYTQLAAIVLVVGLWVVLTGAALTAGGVSSFAPTFYVMIVFIAGLLFGQRAAITTAILCILTAFGLVVMEATGTINSTVLPYTPLARWTAITILTVIVMGLQYLSMQRVNDALKRSRQELEERRRTEAELRRSSERLQLATKAAGIGIWDWDVKNDELVWDDAMYRLYGLQKEDFSGAYDAWANSVAPEDFDRANAKVQAALRGEQKFEGEFRIIWPDGSLHFIKAASQTFRDEVGFPLRMVGVNYDITERTLAEEKFRVLAETAASVILIYQDGKYRYANPAAEAITGYSKEEIMGMKLAQLVHPDFRESIENRVLARERGENVPSRYEVKIVAKNGEERWLDAAGNWMEFEGKPARLVTAFDITERKRAEEALQRNEDLFRAIVEDQNEMIVRWKPDGTRTFVNQAYCRVFSCTPDTCIGTSFYPQIVGEYRERVRERIRSLTPDNPVSTDIHESITGSGELSWQEWTDRGIFDSQGNLVELQSTGRDITERKRAEEQLLFSREQLRALSERLRRAKEEEGVRIARELHDELGSALTSLKWSLLDLKRADPANNEKIVDMVGLVDETINVVRRISSELRPGVLDDLGLVSAIEWHTQQFQANTGIDCECDLLLDDVGLNREQSTVVFRILQEAMTNILRHAQATKVSVVLEEEEGEIVLEVKDNGRGITESEKLGAHSLGLLGMRERASSIDGSIDISGTAGGGTRLVLHVPVESKALDYKTR